MGSTERFLVYTYMMPFNHPKIKGMIGIIYEYIIYLFCRTHIVY